MKTRNFIKMLKSYGFYEVKTKNSKHRKFNGVFKLERPIVISRSAMTKEVPEYIIKQTVKAIEEQKERLGL